MKKILLIELVIFMLIIVVSGCSGLPMNTNIQSEGKISSQPDSVNLFIISNVEKIATENIKRIELLIRESLKEKNITVNNNSIVAIEISFKQYDDGNIAGRGISGALLGINLGESAKIEVQIVISENKKIITKANILVESSKSGWNFSYGYGGAKGLEKGLVGEIIRVIFNTL